MASTPKFNAKNLHYEKQEPAFLRRLRNEAIGAGGGDPDRLNVQHARPGKKSRLQMDADGDDGDDGPTVVYADEAGVVEGTHGVRRDEHEAWKKVEALTKAEAGEAKGGAEAVVRRRGKEGDADDDNTRSGEGVVQGREKQRVADAGGVAKKRKAGKLVGGDEDAEADAEPGKRRGDSAARPHPTATTSSVTKNRPSKKQTKVKLSFDEPDS